MKINLSTMCMEDLQQLQLALLQEIENRHTQERALVMEELQHWREHGASSLTNCGAQ
jgi:hypothetical protein